MLKTTLKLSWNIEYIVFNIQELGVHDFHIFNFEILQKQNVKMELFAFNGEKINK